ncbi:hypothetical protein [uncultured Shewanella sp.]|uniref:hypothetical protein n=1 Tax=uncultured Shewanella sp. TaxID=173975 RepID=UPI0026131FEE|nr:hypothetical protein [uncultured Shewanella sp.]
MKKIISLLLCISLCSCAYNYRVGVPLSASNEEVSVLEASFNFDIEWIDEIPFKEKLNISAIGTNTIVLSPGEHTILFKYCQCSMNQSLYLEEPVLMKFTAEAGKKYELKETKESTGFFSAPKISFEISEVSNT